MTKLKTENLEDKIKATIILWRPIFYAKPKVSKQEMKEFIEEIVQLIKDREEIVEKLEGMRKKLIKVERGGTWFMETKDGVCKRDVDTHNQALSQAITIVEVK